MGGGHTKYDVFILGTLAGTDWGVCTHYISLSLTAHSPQLTTLSAELYQYEWDMNIYIHKVLTITKLKQMMTHLLLRTTQIFPRGPNGKYRLLAAVST